MKKMNFYLFASSAVVSSVMFSQYSTTNAVNFDTSSPSNFINSIAPHAKKLGAERDLYASIMIAQAALESGYGKSELAQNANNLFGVKEKNGGPSYEIASNEYDENDVLYTEISAFKLFSNHLASLEYYTGHFTQTQWYTDFYKGIHRSESPSYKEALQVLNGKYATDPLYVSKLQDLINRYNLTQYDAPSTFIPPTVEDNSSIPSEPNEITPTETTPPLTPPQETTPTIKEGYYTIKQGDSLRDIAKKFNVHLLDLLEWNSLSSEIVNAGTEIIINSKFAPTKTPSSNYNKNGELTHTILKGESIRTINRLYGTIESDILSWNNLKNTNFFVGQVLIVKKPNSYIVVEKDTLYSLSKKFNISVDEIKKLNNLKDNNISIGQSLILSLSNTQTPVPTPPATSNTTNISSPYTTYIVAKGDYLNKIAEKFNSTYNEIYKLNNLNTNILRTGQTLKIPNTSNKYSNSVYTVQKGDYLSKLAKNFNTSMKEIIYLNNLKTNTLRTGQVLNIPKFKVNIKNEIYIVEKGDNLTKISRKFGVNYNNLYNLNNLSSNIIYTRQVLYIPTNKIATTQLAAKHTITHTVKSGETLNKIAQKYNTTVKNIQNLNKLSTTTIKVGQTLRVQ